VPNTENIGLEKLAELTAASSRSIPTAARSPRACGRSATAPPGPWLAHKASHEGVTAAEAIAQELGNKDVHPHPLDRNAIPGCTYCRPQIASVGLTEAKAKEAGHEVKAGTFPFIGNGKAIALGEAEGFVKTVFDAKTGELLGRAHDRRRGDRDDPGLHRRQGARDDRGRADADDLPAPDDLRIDARIGARRLRPRAAHLTGGSMRSMKLVQLVVLALAAASCGGGDSDNVMASQLNALDPAQVDRALGPEIATADANGAETADEVNAVDPVEPTTPPNQGPAAGNRAAASPDPSDSPEAAPEQENTVEEGQ
jgi:hypothetical protein